MDTPILHAYALGETSSILKAARVSGLLRDDALAWVHLDGKHGDTRQWLEDNVSYLDHFVIDALLAEETRPRITEFQDGIMVILRGVNLNENSAPEDMISIRFWIDPNRIISVQLRPLKAVRDIADAIEFHKGPKTSGDFLNALATRLFSRMEPVLSELDERTDNIEEAILDKPDISCRHEVIDIRKKAIILRRYIAPQKDVLSTLRSIELAWIETKHKRGFQESQDRVTRYVEDLDAIRERAQIVKDELANIMADRMNKNMYLLSIVAVIFLPLGFLTGLLGINVGGMPGADNAAAFWIVCAMCASFGFGLIAVFKKLKWL